MCFNQLATDVYALFDLSKATSVVKRGARKLLSQLLSVRKGSQKKFEKVRKKFEKSSKKVRKSFEKKFEK
jgi:hypothetical protein